MVRITRLAGVLAAIVVLTACGAPLPSASPTDDNALECTLIGCESQVVFEIDYDIMPGSEYAVEACVDGECERAQIRVSDRGVGRVANLTASADDVVALVLHGDDYSGSHAVALTVESPDQGTIIVEEEVEFERTQPNGPRCEPVCWIATIPRL
jgi:hypothetical protein